LKVAFSLFCLFCVLFDLFAVIDIAKVADKTLVGKIKKAKPPKSQLKRFNFPPNGLPVFSLRFTTQNRRLAFCFSFFTT